MPTCIHHGVNMRLFQPQNGPSVYTCPTNVGIGQPGANARGYCNYRVPAQNGQGSPQRPSTPQAGPRASSDPKDRSIAIQCCIKAACEVAGGPWSADIPDAAVVGDFAVSLAKRLFREVYHPVMHPVPRPAPAPVAAPVQEPWPADDAPPYGDDPDSDLGF